MINSNLQIIRNIPENNKEIINIFRKVLMGGLLFNFKAVFNPVCNCYEYIFRYKDQTTDSVLKYSNCLVQLDTGNYTVKID